MKIPEDSNNRNLQLDFLLINTYSAINSTMTDSIF